MDSQKIFLLHKFTLQERIFNMDEYWKFINTINKEFTERLMLDRILVVDNYIDKKSEYSDIKLKILPIFKGFSLNRQIKNGIKNNKRFCYITVFRNWKNYQIENSHLMLIYHENNKVYKYNSGFTNKRTENDIDNLIKEYYKENEIKIEFIPTENWCRKCIQGETDLCGQYVLHFYYLLMKNQPKPINEIIEYQNNQCFVIFQNKII